MPYRASSVFLPGYNILRKVKVKSMCQCPIGLLLYFYKVMKKFNTVVNVCQCPIGLLLYFYGENMNILSNALSVSMPYRASSVFLHDWCLAIGLTEEGVNALSGFFCISTQVMKLISIIYQLSVNALSGFFCISTKTCSNELTFSVLCQCPIGLLLYFYTDIVKHGDSINCVNALSGFFCISTVILIIPMLRVNIVSMPYRASSVFLLIG